MSNQEIGAVTLTLCVYIAFVHVFGYIFERLKQPKLVGEILAGVALGPFVLGQVVPDFYQRLHGSTAGGGPSTIEAVLNLIYWIGLFLLMFISGSETRRLMAKENRSETAWMLGVGTPLPFFLVLGLGLGGALPLHLLVGSAAQETSALLILAIAVSVTSIPVISRIFYDLKILHTRFASIILGSAVLEDIILWAVLAVATAIVKSASVAQESVVSEITKHTFTTMGFMLVGLLIAPLVLKHVGRARWNLLARASQKGYVYFVLFSYIAIAAVFDINLVFAAFLAGFGIIGGIRGSERERYAESLNFIAQVSFSLMIPIYFAVVGHRLSLGQDFSPIMLAVFLVGSSALALLSNGVAARLAGFKRLDVVNLAVTTNARGGPGIVLASVAFDAGIINAPFYTTLVLTAILTSQAAGAWLRFVLSRGWPLLSSNPEETWKKSP